MGRIDLPGGWPRSDELNVSNPQEVGMQITPQTAGRRGVLWLALAALLTAAALMAGPARADSTANYCLVFNPDPQLGLEAALENGESRAVIDRRNPSAVRTIVYRCYDGELRVIARWCE